MEEVRDIVIVGAGIVGLTTSSGLHKYSFSLSFYIYAYTTSFIYFYLWFDFLSPIFS